MSKHHGIQVLKVERSGQWFGAGFAVQMTGVLAQLPSPQPAVD
ncbi:MAG: hypothetical protein ACJA00_005606 [Myxococcota bacterium]|jgi:hypothetical protein